MPTIITDTAVALSQATRLDLTKLAPLRPFIFGPQAALHRYAQSAEKDSCSLGNLSFSSQQAFSWPNRSASSVIDLAYTRVYLDNCLLNYLNTTGIPVVNYSNRVRTASTTLQTGNGSNRSAVLLDRDVQIGDTVLVSGASSGAVVGSLRTAVTGLIPDVVASSTTAATADANNKATQTGSGTASQTNGTPFNEVVVVANYAAYSSLADGYVTRTYTVTVIQGSVGGDGTTARLSVVSADGLDNVASQQPAVFGTPTAIGTKGGTATFSINTGHYSGATGYALADFVAGQQWTITFNQAFTAPVATGGGAYSGPSNTTYKITVTLGGLYTSASPPQITVSTTTGLPGSGPTPVTAAGAAVPVGPYSPPVTVAFNATGLRAGDVYYIACTAATPGAIKTLVLQNSLQTALSSTGATVDLTTATTLAVSLYIQQQGAALPQLTSYPVPGNNWTASQSYLTLNANPYTYDPSWTSGGIQQPIAIASATVYVQYREWVPGDGEVHALAKLTDIEPIFGTVDPDNPIAWACQQALRNTAGTVLVNPGVDTTLIDTLLATALTGDPNILDTWATAINQAGHRDNAYNLVPLTANADVQTAVINHVLTQSAPSVGGFFRACFLSASVPDAIAIVSSATTANGQAVLATLSQDPATATASFTIIQVTAGNAHFITNGVVPGDTVRYLYGLNPNGTDSYRTFTVANVISEDSLRLAAGPGGAATVAQRIEVWRTTDDTQAVSQLIAQASVTPSNRVCYVWPDKLSLAGQDQPGYYLCASLAALAGAIPSQRSMRNLKIQGYDAAPRASDFLSPEDLYNLSQHGVFPVTGDLLGNVYTYWPATTDPTSVNSREESIRRNADMVSFAILEQWGSVIGSANLTDTTLQSMRSSVADLVSELVTIGNVGNLGPPVISLTLTSLTQDPAMADQVIATFTLVGPTPSNTVVLILSVA